MKFWWAGEFWKNPFEVLLWQNVKIYLNLEPLSEFSLKKLTQQTQDLWSYPEKYREPNGTDAEPENRPIAQFQIRDDLNVIVAGLQLL